jgi:hypothetical protein
MRWRWELPWSGVGRRDPARARRRGRPGFVNDRGEGVTGALTLVSLGLRWTCNGRERAVTARMSTSDVVEHAMADVWFLLLTVALFAVIGLVARGVERL